MKDSVTRKKEGKSNRSVKWKSTAKERKKKEGSRKCLKVRKSWKRKLGISEDRGERRVSGGGRENCLWTKEWINILMNSERWWEKKSELDREENGTANKEFFFFLCHWKKSPAIHTRKEKKANAWMKDWINKTRIKRKEWKREKKNIRDR